MLHMDIVTPFRVKFLTQNISKKIENMYIDTKLVLFMYNADPYFCLKSLGKKVHTIQGNIW